MTIVNTTCAGWSVGMLERRWHDLRYASRMLRRNPGLTTVAVVTLGLGIGATAAVVSILDAGLFRSLPVPHPERLVLLHWTASKTGRSFRAGTSFHGCEKVTAAESEDCAVPHPVYEALRDAAREVVEIAAFSNVDEVQIATAEWTSTARAQFVSWNFFTVLGTRAQTGRVFTSRDDSGGGESVALVSDRCWRLRFGGDPGIVGRSITVNGTALIVVGITSRAFYGVDPANPPEFWIPLRTGARLENPSRWSKWVLDEQSLVLAAIGRVAPGVGLTGAQSRLQRAYHDVLIQHGGLYKLEDGASVVLSSSPRGLNELRTKYRRPLVLLRWLVLLVLAVACANVATLLLARASTRRKEIATRLAIGQGRTRLVAQLLTEAGLLSTLGVVAGLVVGAWASRAIVVFLAPEAETSAVASGNVTILMVAGAIGVTTTFIFGLAPAWAASSVRLARDLQTGATLTASASRGGRVGPWLVTSEVAVALVLLVGAGLFLRTVLNLVTADPGFPTEHLLNVSVSPLVSPNEMPPVADQLEPLRSRLAALPGVRSVTWSSKPLLAETYEVGPVFVDMKSGVLEMGDRLQVGPDFFATTGIPLLAGRDVAMTDLQDGGQAVWINRQLARRAFGNRHPVGATITLPGRDRRLTAQQVAGLVGDANYHDIRMTSGPGVYFAGAVDVHHFVLRTTAGATGLAASIERAVRQVSPGLMAHDIREARQQAERQIFAERLMARASVAFGGLAVLLAAVGIYGVLSYSVAVRTREIAVRMSLGAARADILRLVLGEGLRLAALGAVIGLLAGAWASRLISGLLFGVRPLDPLTYGIATLVLLCIAAMAGFLPAARASRVEPIVALRAD